MTILWKRRKYINREGVKEWKIIKAVKKKFAKKVLEWQTKDAAIMPAPFR